MKTFRQMITWLVLVTALLAQCQVLAGDSERPLLVLYAFPEEGQELANRMTVDKCDTLMGRPVRSGILAGNSVVVAESGMGMTNAAMMTQLLIDKFNPRGVVFSGIAGAIDSSVHIGDIVICRKWATHDYVYIGKDSTQCQPVISFSGSADSVVELTFFDADSSYLRAAEAVSSDELPFKSITSQRPRVLLEGVGVSGNAFIDNAGKRAWLQQVFGAHVTDMESAAVAQVCTANNLPFIVSRSTSDLAGGSGSESAQKELNRFFEVAAGNSALFVISLIERL